MNVIYKCNQVVKKQFDWGLIRIISFASCEDVDGNILGKVNEFEELILHQEDYEKIIDENEVQIIDENENVVHIINFTHDTTGFLFTFFGKEIFVSKNLLTDEKHE